MIFQECCERDEASAGRGGQTGPRPARPAAPGAGPRQEEAARDQQILLHRAQEVLQDTGVSAQKFTDFPCIHFTNAYFTMLWSLTNGNIYH